MIRLLCLPVFLVTSLLPLNQLAAADAVSFDKQIQPLLVERCGKCHGEKKGLAKLRLHTAEAIKSFHEEELLVAGKPDESELYQRIVLPADDKKRMPKGGDPLPQEEIDLIRNWILQGAELTSAPAPTPPAPETKAEEKAESAPPAQAQAKSEEDLIKQFADVPAAAAEAIQRLEQAGAAVLPLYAGSNLLQVSFAQAETPATDEALAALPALAPQIVWLNLAGSQATPAGFAALAKQEHLTRLHLEKSSITDEAMPHLAGLANLIYLNLYNTQITDQGLAHVKSLEHLRKVYLWNTKVSYDAAMQLQEQSPGREVNLGWDHPEVARRRITKQLEETRKVSAEAKAEATKLQEQAKAAQEQLESTNKQIEELEKQLKELDNQGADGQGEAEEPAAEKPAAEKEDPPAEAPKA
jgi:hypothetical protein